MKRAIAALLALSACEPRTEPPLDRLARGRQLTTWLHAGAFDLLPPGLVIDLAGDGDTMLVRWFVDRKSDSLGREWPAGVTLTLEGRAAAGTFLQRLQATYGREQELVEDGVYPYVGLRRSVEYDRIARFSGLANNTVTVSWLWKADTLIGGWITPSLRAAPTEYGAYETKTTLRLPFDGEWLVTGGGRKPHENHHVQHPTLRFAYDFLIDSAGSAYRTDGKDNVDYYCHGQPILAPGAGRVVTIVDSFAENTPWHTPPGYRGPGNHIIIDHGNGEYSTLAHLRGPSVSVEVGQAVVAGQQVGECGNNGFSFGPHLHYQLQLDPRPGQRVVPAFFRSYRVDDVLVEQGEPRGGQHVRNEGRP